MTLVERLVKARGLIEKGWCQGSFSKDENGRNTPYGGPAAVQFCMSGALREVNCADPDQHRTQTALNLLREVTEWPIAPWNDQPGRTKEEVLAAYDKAIDLAAGIR